MERHVEAGGEERAGAALEGAAERLHRQIVADEEAFEADGAADDRIDDDRRGRRRALRINCGVDEMGRHRHRQVAKRDKRCKIAFERTAGSLDNRQFEVAVDPRAAMAGDVLDHRRDAARNQCVGDRTAKRGDPRRIVRP